jgi:hypothetical protein
MDILQQIKTDRAQKKKKQPFSPTLFDRISGLVKEYRLGESFLEKLENPADFLQEKEAEFALVRKKQPFMIPLFSLTEQKEYVLTLAIIEKADNPYLEFAQSPEEIALSKLLFDLNPALGPEKLERYHFETLMHYAQAKTTVKELVKDIRRKVHPGSEEEFIEKERLPQHSLENRMVRLQNFMAQVEESQGR